MALFVLLALVLAGRLVFLTLVEGPQNAQEAAKSRTVSVVAEAKRGTIYDRNGNILATSVDATTIYCNPYEVDDASWEASQIAGVLGGQASDYEEALTSSNTSFAYVERKADVGDAQKIKELGLDGIYFLSDTKRVYPCGQTAGQVVGLCDSDGNGISGLELYYDEQLAGTDGELEVERGGGNYPIAGGLTEVTEAQDGQDIVVSIDIEMQAYLEEKVKEAQELHGGERADAVLYDGGTGEIIAIASTPFLNPADRSSVEEGATSLVPINNQYEPGSIFKSVTMSAILLNPDSEIYCPEYLQADEYTISDSHERTSQTMSLTRILAESSNVGTSLAAKELGFGALYDKILEYNFTEKTGVDFPGEQPGSLSPQNTWSTVRSYNVSFGQGVLVTPLQMTRFYGALVNDGVECTPHFLVNWPQAAQTPSYEREQVVENTAAIAPLISMMKQVVADKNGTGTDAQMEGFEPAGKTGTAEYTGEDGYYVDDSYNISFVGFLPDTNSQLVCFVGVTEVYEGGSVAGTFKDIMQFAVNHYRISAQ